LDHVMGWSPESNAHLDFLFHQSVSAHFPESGFGAPSREDYLDGQD